jgi:hypothetical protein
MFQEEIDGDILGRQDQGGGLGRIWNGRKLRGEGEEYTYKFSERG